MQVFEHDKITVGQEQFTRDHWESLANSKKLIESGVITIYNEAIKFSEYVGVLQVGSLTFEILPKIDKDEHDTSKWQPVLIEMLRECHWMKHQTFNKAPLKLKHNSILEAYLDLFLTHCEHLLRLGLIKKYRKQKSNKFALKGKLMISSNIRRNLVHQERFYTESMVYNHDNIFNRILLKAIRFIPVISKKNGLRDRVGRLILDFPELPDMNVDFDTFKRLVYDRKTIHYKEAIEIAAMLLLNYRPDICGGRNHVLTILFDMNKLWEEYVFRQIRKNLPDNWDIEYQSRRPFWEFFDESHYKRIEPDIVLSNAQNEAFIIDTKWKLPEDNIPADADLKQMFVYNEYWGGKHAVLLYPKSDYSDKLDYYAGRFLDKPGGIEAHCCGLMKVSVLNSINELDYSLGKKIVNFICCL